MQGKEINVVINESHKEHYININLTNQLLIPESNIIEKENMFQRKIWFAGNDMKLRSYK
jgi:hypothetical protein